MVLNILGLRVGLTSFQEVLEDPWVQNVCKVYTVVFVGEALIVLGDISKVVEIAGREFVKDLFELALRRVAVLLHKVVSDAKGEARDTHVPVHIPYVEWKVTPRIERERLEYLCVSLLFINILDVNEVTKRISNVLNLLPKFIQLVCLLYHCFVPD